jgi:membrane protease YdiL (CAAX protease family)
MRDKKRQRELISLLVGLPVVSTFASFTIFAPLFTPGSNPTTTDFQRASTILGIALLVIEVVATILLIVFLRRENRTLGTTINFQQNKIPLYLRTGLFALLPTLIAGWLFVQAQVWSGVETSLSKLNRSEIVLWFVLIPIAASFLEEAIWRGYAIPRLRGTWRSVLLSSLSFAIFHGIFNPLVLVTTFLQGVVWGWTYRQTDSTVPGMVLHFLSRYLVFVPGFG